jgi:hypothetical protein
MRSRPQRPPANIYYLCSIYLLIYQDISEYNEFVDSSHHCVLQNKNKGRRDRDRIWWLDLQIPMQSISVHHY